MHDAISFFAYKVHAQLDVDARSIASMRGAAEAIARCLSLGGD